MKETSEKLLFAEYSRLVELEMFRHEQYEQSLQLYLTIIGIATGILLFLIEKGTPLNLPFYSILLLIGVVLAIGEFTFLRQIGIDISMRQNAQAIKLIREKLLEGDTDFGTVFLSGLIQNNKRLKSFHSFKGIIHRALTKSQQKTIVVLLNCAVFTALLLQLTIWNISANFWAIVVVGVLVFVIVGGLHAFYASWRYKQSEKEINSGELNYWI